MAASLGHDAVGVDTSTRAIELAKTKAAERGLTARFVVADALRLIDLGEQFDTVLDCGLFHVFDDDERERYVDSLAEVVPPGGRYHMLCFSDRQPGDWGPRRVTQDEIRVAFSAGWESNPSSPPSSISPGTPQEPWPGRSRPSAGRDRRSGLGGTLDGSQRRPDTVLRRVAAHADLLLRIVTEHRLEEG